MLRKLQQVVVFTDTLAALVCILHAP